ncbi:hypothetical protein [Streptosporangium sandarakinum]|uniref:hypothetical protein n=1 Tax=Streptosporangium sandarakinum TaxID=1260955 RepID=UPI003799BAED
MQNMLFRLCRDKYDRSCGEAMDAVSPGFEGIDEQPPPVTGTCPWTWNTPRIGSCCAATSGAV